MRPAPCLPNRSERTSAANAIGGRRRKRFLSFEPLEARRQLAAYIVDTFTDAADGFCGIDGVGNDRCTLRSAIIAANNNPGSDSISLLAGTYDLSIPPSGLPTASDGDLNITDDLVITGTPSDPSQTVIDANQIDRVLSIGNVAQSAITVVLSGLSLQRGLSAEGIGAGGIDVSTGASVELRSVFVRNNRADQSLQNGGDADGGGISVFGATLTIDDSTISGNFADGFGGGIAVFEGSILNVTNSSILGNSSTNDGGGIWAGNRDVVEINIDQTSIQENQTLSGEGGGLFVDAGTSTANITLTDTLFRSNIAAAGGGGASIIAATSITQTGGTYDLNETTDGAGGGLKIVSASTVIIEGTSFTRNKSDDGGGGAVLYTSATFNNVLIEENEVTGSPLPGQLRFDLGGGGIAIAQLSSVRPTVRISDSSILNNIAALAAGIGSVNSFVEVINSTIDGNQGTGNVGGGGGIGFAQDDVSGNVDARVRLTVSNSQISNNTSATEAGGIGIADADATFTDTAVFNNTASGGRGGGIGMIGFNNSPILRLNRVTLDNNNATSDGGGVALADAGFFFSNTTISDNSAGGNGGGIAYANTDTSVSGGIEFSTIASNTGQFGSNVAVNGSVTRFLSSIVVNPLGTAPIINMVSGGPGQLSSQGFNIFSNTNFSNPASNDLLGVDPLLAPLINNGGGINTRAILSGSPAIDAGANAPLAVDARGFTRPVDGDGNGAARNDIGAFEAGAVTSSTFTISGVVFVDANANGFDSNDQRLSGIQIRLFRDGGDGVFGGDDTLVGSTNSTFSPVSGGYTFLNIAPGLYFVEQEPATDPPNLVRPVPARINLTANSTVDFANLISSVVALPDTVTVSEDTPANIAVLTNDSAGVGTLRILSTTTPTNGAVTIVGDQIRYVPSANYFGPDSFTYTITNAPVGSSGATSFATVSITVSSINDDPNAADDILSATSQTPLIVPFATLFANDNAGPANEPQSLSITAVSQPANGTVVLTSTGITYTPPSAFVGSTSFSYTVADSGGLTDTATVVVNVAAAGTLADLSASLFSPDAVRTGSTFTYFGSVFNSGPATASNVVATISLPAAVTFVSATTNAGVSSVTGNMVRITIPQLLSQTSVSFEIVVSAATTSPGTFSQASLIASTPTPESSSTNNFDVSLTRIVNIHRLTTGTADGDVTIDVDSTGAFGDGGLGISDLLTNYNPLGMVPTANTVFDSRLGIRSTSGTYESLQATNSAISILSQVAGSVTSATSRFSFGPYTITLLQNVTPTLASDGTRLGAQLTQTYSFQNSSSVPQNLGLVRYIDADLLFDGSIDDGGGALIGPDGNMILFETDKGGSGATDATFVGITNSGGVPETSGFFEIDEFSALLTRLFETGNPNLDNSILRDTDNNGFVDAGSEYDVELALANRFPGLAPGATATFVTKTIFGDRPTSVAPTQSANLTGQVGCDADGDGVVEATEVNSGITVFVDLNGNRMLDSGEPSTQTDSTGTYRLDRLNVPVDKTANVIVQNPPSCFAAAPDIGVTREALNTGSLSRSVTATDINGDGAIDMLIANELGNDVSVYLNSPVAQGSFTQASPFSLSKRPVAITSWQAPGASFPVVAVAAIGTTSNRGSVFVIDGGLNAAPREFTMGDGPISIAVNDFNGDNQADFVTASYRSGTIVARMSGVSGERVIATTRNPKSVTAADVNGDSNVDIVVASYGFDGDDSSEVIVLLGNGRGEFAVNRQTLPGRGAIDVAVANFDDDSADEIVVASYNGTIQIFNFRNGSLQRLSTVTTEVGVESIAVQDINQDGRTDLVIANSRAETVELFVNQSTGFVRNRTITGVPSPSDIVIARFDSDDVLDVAVTNLYGTVGPNYTLPSKVTVLGLTISEREVTLTANQTTTENFKFAPNPRSVVMVREEAIRARDVDRNGTVSPRDALLVINAMSRQIRSGEGEQNHRKGKYKLDINGDGKVTAIDALLVINYLSLQNRQRSLEGELLPVTQDDDRERRESATDVAMLSISELF